MAFLQTQFYSETLALHVTVNVLLPVAKAPAQQRELPVLYLLHGYFGSHSDWTGNTPIERHIAALTPEFAVVMPSVDHSFSTDNGTARYWTFVSQELPAVMGSLFPLSSKREDTYVAGLSMGGYGALKLALSHPERFRAVAALSAVADVESVLFNGDPDISHEEMQRLFGTVEAFKGSANDLFHLAEAVARGPVQPDLYIACGDKDVLYADNQRFFSHAQALGLPVSWHSGPGHDHTWDYWDEQIQVVLRMFHQMRSEAMGK